MACLLAASAADALLQPREEIEFRVRGKKEHLVPSIGKRSPSSSFLTGRGICGSPCNSSGRELERRRERKECKSGHGEVTCLPVSHVPTLGPNFDVRGPRQVGSLSRKYRLIKHVPVTYRKQGVAHYSAKLPSTLEHLCKSNPRISLLTCRAASRRRGTLSLK